jgi:hypothetical protein
MQATIIAYRNSKDIDIQFKDGYIARNKKYSNFIRGNILNKNIDKSVTDAVSRIGETRLMNCGMQATIIAYRSSSDIDVQFEDGTIVRNRAYYTFKNRRISNKEVYKDRLGETRLMNCGMQATIIGYRKSNDIDIQFEDGTIFKNRNYTDFTNGKIQNKNMFNFISNRTGETRMMNCGMQATIMIYHNTRNVDIQFEDGTILKHRNYSEFAHGLVHNPNLKSIRLKNRSGESRAMNCGMKATIIEYREAKDIDIQFEDKTVVKHRNYGAFKRGNIMYPNKTINDVEIGQEAYRSSREVYYNCTCKKCNNHMMLTLHEILQHKC